MRRWKLAALALCAALLGALAGCGDGISLTANPQELYVLPKLPAKYMELNSLISAVLSDGAEYAAPTAGANIQPVQLVDLDGDGGEEAVGFFRNSGEEKPLKILVFTTEGEGYRLLDQIEGSGSSIYSVYYADMDGNGKQEIVVGWKATAELQVLEVYALSPGGAQLLIRTDYVKYKVVDLDGDGRQGLVVLRADEDGESIADYYSWQEDGTLASRSPARISSTMAELSQQGKVIDGALRDGVGALYVTGVTDQMMAVTDILTLRGGELSNIVLSMGTGVSGEIAPFCSLYPSDINADGVTEVPRPVSLTAPWGDESRLIEWCRYDESGAPDAVLRTYHNLDDGWYLRVPSIWDDGVTISRTSRTGEAAATFSMCGESQADSQPFLKISVLTGTGREMRATRSGRFVLRRESDAIYTGELLLAPDDTPYGMTEEEVRAAFSRIEREWVQSDA